MLVLLGVLELEADSAVHIIILVVDGQLDLFLALADLVGLLPLLGVELDVDLDGASESSEERGNLILDNEGLTMTDNIIISFKSIIQLIKTH